MQRVLEIFKELAAIPHCSKETGKLQTYIIDFAIRCGCDVQSDQFGNILASNENAEITLQSHYDMVCMGSAPKIEIVIEGDIMRARNSSLGADNGMGCAMMLALLEEGKKVDCLFTNDEEVGLIGAHNLQLELKTPKMLNLDSKEEGKVYLGCAGGVDVRLTREETPKAATFENLYEISAQSQGGHSGVDIHKPIPNAITEIAAYLQDKEFELVKFVGGQRRNAIPSFCKAVVAAKKLPASDAVKVLPVHGKPGQVLGGGKALIEKVANFKNGVHRMHEQLGIPQDSVNLALIENAKIECSIRSMSAEGLKAMQRYVRDHFEGFDAVFSDWYDPWEPKVTEFAKQVQKAYGGAEFTAIHAGLECAVFSKMFPNMQIVSLGPDIFYPHSVKEYTSLRSCERVFKLIKTLL